jgi:hypothetical protein
MKAKKPTKIRQNFTLSPSTMESLRAMAEESDLSMSALINQWIREKWDSRQPSASSPKILADPPGQKNGTTGT